MSILRVLNYNEQKVQKRTAECLFAGNFLQQVNELNFHEKLYRFQGLIEQNNSRTNTLHISLNFHPSEHFSKEKLIAIAESYMGKIGFSEQPFLVYQHFDAGHPHLHIVTTNIQKNGRRIDTYNIGRNQSEKARKEIEVDYGLMKASRGNQEQREDLQAINVKRVKYGLTETKRSISNVLRAVLNQYKFTSIAELNAVLKLYNVIADQGSTESRTYRNRGLNYRLLDEKGNKIGVDIKASSIYFKPTLNFLEKKFSQNEALRIPFMSKLKSVIDWTLSKKLENLQAFVSELKKEKVSVIIRQNDQGFVYGMTFIDHRTKAVFNGSDLGKEYSAAGLQQRISKIIDGKVSTPNLPGRLAILTTTGRKHNPVKSKKDSDHKLPETFAARNNLLQLLLSRERNEYSIPFDLIKKKKKRRPPKL